MQEMPEISNYGQYSSGNYGAHSLRVSIGELTLYFSYKTVVAFANPKDGQVVSENSWGATTGKHLNWIDGGNKKSRLPREEFEERLKAAMKRYGFAA